MNLTFMGCLMDGREKTCLMEHKVGLSEEALPARHATFFLFVLSFILRIQLDKYCEKSHDFVIPLLDSKQESTSH